MPYAKRRAVQIELEKMLEGDIIDVYKRQELSTKSNTCVVLAKYIVVI